MNRSSSKNQFVVSVLLPDRVGILNTVSKAIADYGGNIDSLSQTVTNGYFTLVLTAQFEAPVSREGLQQAIARGFDIDEASIVVREHTPPPSSAPPTQRYILTMSGADRPGLLKTVTGFLVEKGINIIDYYFDFHRGKVVHIAEVEIAEEKDVHTVSESLKQLLANDGFQTTLQHEYLFRATNEIFSIRQLVKKPHEKH